VLREAHPGAIAIGLLRSSADVDPSQRHTARTEDRVLETLVRKIDVVQKELFTRKSSKRHGATIPRADLSR
jgi:hypothetical protein